MTLVEHLRELRNRLLKAGLGIALGGLLGWIWYDTLFDILVHPFDQVIEEARAQGRTVVLALTGVTDAFTLKLKLALVFGVIISAPIWLYQLWRFIAPGLVGREKRWAYGFAVAATPLFLAGVALGYYVLPRLLGVLLDFTPEGVDNSSVDYYLSFFLQISSFGIALIPMVFVMLNFAASSRASLRLVAGHHLRHLRRRRGGHPERRPDQHGGARHAHARAHARGGRHHPAQRPAAAAQAAGRRALRRVGRRRASRPGHRPRRRLIPSTAPGRLPMPSRTVAWSTPPREGKAHGARAGPPARSAASGVSLAMAREAIGAGAQALVACGGDGTVHLALQAVAGTDVPLGVIPVAPATTTHGCCRSRGATWPPPPTSSPTGSCGGSTSGTSWPPMGSHAGSSACSARGSTPWSTSAPTR
jgi:Tat protein translocase TatC